MLKKIILVFLLCVIGKANAQSFTDGIFTTTFGNISWTSETGTDYPNGGIVYGDYRGNGTLIGKFDNNGKEVNGSFFNGSSEGKFIFMVPYGKNNFFDQGIKTFAGNWGYTSNNKYSTNSQNEWKVTGKIGEKAAIKNVTNVWSGKWNTTDGAMYLLQNGNKITGTYKGVGTVEATYNPATRFLKGTFKNTNINKTGYLEFYFEGNSFKGKWGWTTAMTGGNWDGTKHVKNNKEVGKSPANASSTSTNNIVNPPLQKVNDVTYECQFDFLSSDDSYSVYGIGWIRLFVKNKLTNKMETVNPHLFNYLDKYGRVFEIPKKNAVNQWTITLMNAPIRFKFNPNDYGYNSLDEMKGEAYFEFQFEVKIDGIISDEIVGKKSVKVFLENANIKKWDMGETILYTPVPGFYNIEKGDKRFGVYHSVKKVN